MWKLLSVRNRQSLSHAAYLHHWLLATIHFNRYNLCFDKYTECGDKCKSLYLIALHIRVVPLLFNSFVECPLLDTMYWVIGFFRRYVTERLLNTKVVKGEYRAKFIWTLLSRILSSTKSKVVIFLGFLWWFDYENVFLILILGQLKDIVYVCRTKMRKYAIMMR